MSQSFTTAAEGLERHRFSVSDIDRMVEAGVLDAEGRYELIDGEIVPMAAQHTPHARMLSKLHLSLATQVDRKAFEVFLGATVELSGFTRVDPDIYVARAGVATRIVRASDVLWAIEISDATRRKDLKVKAPLYAAAAIQEYWVVDLEEGATHVHRGPSPSGWTTPILRVPFEGTIAPAQFPDLRLTLASL